MRYSSSYEEACFELLSVTLSTAIMLLTYQELFQSEHPIFFQWIDMVGVLGIE